jgi:cytochrome c-type biogenesis protein CcsB
MELAALFTSENGTFQLSMWLLFIALAGYIGRSLTAYKPLWIASWVVLLLSGMAMVASLWFRSEAADYFTLSNMYESLMSLAILMLAAFLVMDRWFKLRHLGWPVCLMLVATVGFAATLPTEITPLQAALQSYWRAIHVPIIIASYAMFTLSFITSAAFLVTDYFRQPASAGSSAAMGNPSSRLLQTYDEVTYRCISLGFPLLAVGIILGGLWANEAWGNYWSWDPKESMSLVTLLAYGVYLHLRVNGSHSPRLLAWVSMGGFVMMLITYFGVNIMGLGLHSYGKIG